jgi:hypothetical protein
MSETELRTAMDRLGLVPALARGELMRLVLAITVTVALGLLLVVRSPPAPVWPPLAGILGGLGMAVAVAGWWWADRGWRRDRAALPVDARMRVVHLAEAVQRRSMTWMAAAMVGHGLLAIGLGHGLALAGAHWPGALAASPVAMAVAGMLLNRPSRDRLAAWARRQ